MFFTDISYTIQSTRYFVKFIKKLNNLLQRVWTISLFIIQIRFSEKKIISLLQLIRKTQSWVRSLVENGFFSSLLQYEFLIVE